MNTSELNELQTLVHDARNHLVELQAQIKGLDAMAPSDKKVYLLGAHETAILNLFQASNLLGDKLAEARGK